MPSTMRSAIRRAWRGSYPRVMYLTGLIRQHQSAVRAHPATRYEFFINSLVEPLHLVLGPVRVFVLLVFYVHVKMCTTLDEIKLIGQRIREILLSLMWIKNSFCANGQKQFL